MPTEAERQAVSKERERRRLLRGGLGFYTYQQERNTTPFQFAAQIIVGAVVVFVGLILVSSIWQVRAREIASYGVAESHIGSFAFALALILVGVFMAHAGVIFYWKKFRAHRRKHN